LNIRFERQPRRETAYTLSHTSRRMTRKHNCYARRRAFLELLYIEIGSIEERRPRLSIRKAGIKAGIPTYGAAYTIYRSYKDRDGYLKHPSELSHNATRARKWGPYRYKLDKHRDYLKSNIYRWRCLSLQERTVKIQKDRGTHCSTTCLTDWYHRNGCAYLKPSYHITNSYSRVQMLTLQREFSLKIMDMWDKDCEVIFIDECTCNPWNKGIKMWVDKSNPFQLDLAPTRKGDTGSAAVLGAISSK
jgi:hypothetical protein